MGNKVSYKSYLRGEKPIKSVITASVSGSGDSNRNEYGIAEAHAYSILDTVELRNHTTNEVLHKLLVIRNPWG